MRSQSCGKNGQKVIYLLCLYPKPAYTAFMFASREDMITGTSLLHNHLQRFGMFMHVRSCATDTSEGSKSKTEAVLFPHKNASVDEIQSNSAFLDLVSDSGGFITFTNKFDPANLEIVLTMTRTSSKFLKLSVHFSLAYSGTKEISAILSDIVFSWWLS